MGSSKLPQNLKYTFQIAIIFNIFLLYQASSHTNNAKSQIKDRIVHDPDIYGVHSEFRSVQREIRAIREYSHGGNKIESHRKRGMASFHFSSWTSWTICDSDCKQKRERYCIRKRKCGSTKHVEERHCPKSFCSTSSPAFQPIDSKQTHDTLTKSIQTINLLNYPDTNRNTNNKEDETGENDYVLVKKRKHKKRRRKPIVVEVEEDDENDDFLEKTYGFHEKNDEDNDYDDTDLISDRRDRDISVEVLDMINEQNQNHKKIEGNRLTRFKNINHAQLKDGNRNENSDESEDDIEELGLEIPNHQLDKTDGLIFESVDFTIQNKKSDHYATPQNSSITTISRVQETTNKRDSNEDYGQFTLGDDDYDDDSDENIQSVDDDQTILKKSILQSRRRGREHAVVGVEQATRFRRVYSRWSRWSKCSTKCTTRRFKRCRIKEICRNEVLRETAYCYVEGTFCQEWIKSQMHNINIGAKPVPQYYHLPVQTTTTTTTTTPPPPPSPVPYHNSLRRSHYYHRPRYQQYQQQISNNVECERQQTPIYAPLNLRCGYPTRNRNRPNMNNFLKIIGGKPAGKGQYPWQVAVLNKHKEVFCGGTLISPLWVLSAAHCVRRKLYVKLGVYNINNTRDRNVLMFEVAMSIKHPEYNKRTVDNDIAMLKLPQTITPRNNIGYACLPQRFQPLPVGNPCTIIGWGKMKNNDISGTNLLHAAEVPIISNEECRLTYIDYKITKNMFCAGHKRGRIDTCAGDSGGPLLCRDSSKNDHPWTVFGVTSFGDGCGKEDKFGIYTKLPNYVDWIWSVVNCNGYCNSGCRN